MNEKTCSVCGETKPLDEFYFAAHGRYARTAECKACSRVKSRNYYRMQQEARKAALANRQKAATEPQAEPPPVRRSDLPDPPHPSRYKELEDLEALANVLDGAAYLKRYGWRPGVDESASLEEWEW